MSEETVVIIGVDGEEIETVVVNKKTNNPIYFEAKQPEPAYIEPKEEEHEGTGPSDIENGSDAESTDESV